MTFPKACVALVALSKGTLSVHAPEMLEEAPTYNALGNTRPCGHRFATDFVSADEVIVPEAIIYDPVNNVLAGDIHWSASNGSISDDGLFFPWSAGLVGITAEHNGWSPGTTSVLRPVFPPPLKSLG